MFFFNTRSSVGQEDRDKVDDVVADAAGVLVKVVTTGLDRAMNVANNRAK